MRLVVDTNILIAALIKEGISRRILFDPRFTFFSPDISLSEIKRYKQYIIKKTHAHNKEFEKLFGLIFENISIIPKEEYKKYLTEADKILGHIDPEDVPFIALALSISNDGIWTDDKHFEKQDKIKVWNTIKLKNLL